MQFCLTAALQRRARSCFGQAPARSARRCPKLLEQGQGRSQRDPVAWATGPQAQIRCQKTGPSRGPKNGAAKWTQLPQYSLELDCRGETATPKLGPFGGPRFGVANSSIFGLNPALSRLLHSGDSGPQTDTQRGKINLRRQLSCGSDQHERNVHSCSSASLQHYKDERAVASDKPPRAQHDAAQSYWNKGRGAADEIRLLGPTGSNSVPKGPSRGPKNGAAKWTQLPQYSLELSWRGETATQNWGRLAALVLGSRILLCLGSIPRFPDCYTQATLAHRQALNVERSITENHDLRSFLVEAINMKETCTGEAHTREARIA